MIKKLNKLIFTLAIFFTAIVTANAAACGAYHYIPQSTAGGITGYCIDPGASGGLNATVNKSVPQEISGPILNWAQSFATAEQQQMAYRLIAAANGLSKNIDDCLVSGGYNDSSFVQVYASWKEQPSKTIETSVGNSVFMTVVSRTTTATTFTAVVQISGNGNNPTQIFSNSPGVTITPSTITGDGKVTVTGPLSSECDGPNSTVYVYAKETATDQGQNGVSGNWNISVGSMSNGCINGDRVRWFYYPMPSPYQSFIVPVPEGRPIPGCDPYSIGGGTGGSGKVNKKGTPTNITNYSGMVEIDANPDGCNGDCSADYSENFACESGKESKTFLHETKNILGCLIKDKYKESDNCNSSVKKTTDVGKEPVPTINGDTRSVTLGDNPYCPIYCIENVDYNLPGAIKVNNGRYFTMADGTQNKNIKIEGTRTCYTSKIDNTTFALKMKKQQNIIVKAYNEYLKDKAYFENSESLSGYEKTEEKCNVQKCDATQNKVKDPITGDETTNTTYSVSDSGSGTSYYTYTKKFKYPKYNCVYNATNGEATCTKVQVQGSITVSDTKGSDGENGMCDSTSYVTKCPTITKTAEQNLKEEHNKYVNYRSHLSKMVAPREAMKKTVQQYKSCYKWTNNYCFDPKIKFKYEDGEVYTEVNDQYLTGESAEAKSKKSGDVATEYENQKQFFASVTNEYEGSANGSLENSVNYVFITGEEFEYKQAQIDYTNHYVKSTSKKNSTFTKSSVQVCTYYPYGTITTGNGCSNGENKITLGQSEGLDGYVFPVTLEKKETRKYNYWLYFENIGVAGNDASCDSAQTNRLMGCQGGTDIYTKYSQKTEDKYKCEYSGCPDCPTTCKCPENRPDCHVEKSGEDTICVYDTPDDCPNCPTTCIGCIWNDDNSTFAYEQVSLNKIFPNSESTGNKAEDVGYNWNTNAAINPNAEKAEKTITEIQKEKDEAYDKEPQYSYTLTPSIMSQIRDYNKKENENGGYNNNTLECTNGLHCKSTFLNDLKKKGAEKKRNTHWDDYSDGTAWK